VQDDAVVPDEASTDTANPPTVLDRMITAGMSREKCLAFLEASAVVVDGERMSDPDRPAPPPARITVNLT
jgi:hypothetical protein